MLEVGIVLELERGGIRLAVEIVEADVVGALDGHGHRLGRTVDGGHRERVGQRVAGVQRLDRGIALIERIRPRAAGRHREAAVAVIARLRTGHRRERVVRVVDVLVGQGAARAGRRVAGLLGSTTQPCVSPQMTAASLLPSIVMVTVCAVPSTVLTTKVSVSVWPTLSAWTAQLPLSSV